MDARTEQLRAELRAELRRDAFWSFVWITGAVILAFGIGLAIGWWTVRG